MLKGIIEQFQKEAQNASGFKVGQKVYVLHEYDYHQKVLEGKVTSIGYDIASGESRVLCGGYYYKEIFVTKSEAEEARKKRLAKYIKSKIKTYQNDIAKDTKRIRELKQELEEVIG